MATGALVPTVDASDFQFEGAATGASKIPGGTDVRTTGPHVISTLTLVHAIEAKGHTIDSVSFTYRYLAGYDSGPGEWPVLSADLVSAVDGKLLKSLYTSPPLDKYKWDSGDSYSPPIQALSPAGLAVANDDPAFVRITVKNNARNLQIPLDPKLGLNVTVHWAAAPIRFTHAQFGTG
eukprot:COSAG05_NODE_1503_length_4694_cov_3.721219_5_plen_177_part_01